MRSTASMHRDHNGGGRGCSQTAVKTLTLIYSPLGVAFMPREHISKDRFLLKKALDISFKKGMKRFIVIFLVEHSGIFKRLTIELGWLLNKYF